MKYKIKNIATGTTYEVESFVEVSLDVVWSSQKNFFTSGNRVLITDENGKSKTFTK